MPHIRLVKIGYHMIAQPQAGSFWSGDVLVLVLDSP
jgi:hypothetical protein